VEAMVTVPNDVNTAIRRRIRSLGEDGFRDVAAKALANLRPLLRAHPGAVPWFRGIQRRYPTQSSPALVDARIEFDLRTAISGAGKPKHQPNWFRAAYQSFADKKGANYQIQMGVLFRYEYCPELKKPDALGLIAEAWLGFAPLVALGRS